MFLIRKTDIPFSREDANRFLPLVIGLMVCLTGLFLAAALSIGESVRSAGSLDIQTVQVYIPYGAKTTDAHRDKIAKDIQALDTVAEVAHIRKSELAKLISPWTGGTISLDDLPLPTVLEVTLKKGTDRDAAVEQLSKTVKQAEPKAEIEHYQQWVDQLMQFNGMLRMVAITLAVLLTVSLVVIVVLAARTSLKLNFRTVALLHNIGAQDDYIMRQFVSNGLWMVLRGAMLGTGVAIIVAIGVATLSSELSSPLLPTLALLPSHMVMFVGLPVFTAMVAYAAVRLTIQSMLEHMH